MKWRREVEVKIEIMEREEEFTFSKPVDLEIRLSSQATLSSLLHYLCSDSLSGNTWIPPANPECVKLNGKEWRGALRQEATFLVNVLFCEFNTYQYKGAGWHSTLHSQIVAVEHMRLNLHTWIFKYFPQTILSSSCHREKGPRKAICYQHIRAKTESSP